MQIFCVPFRIQTSRTRKCSHSIKCLFVLWRKFAVWNGKRKRNIEFVLFAIGRTSLMHQQHDVSAVCYKRTCICGWYLLCAQRNVQWSVATSSARKFDISKSIEYIVAAKTWRSTNWRLAWSIYLKLRTKCKKGQRHHTIIRWRSRSVRLNTCRLPRTIYIYSGNTCWYDGSFFMHTLNSHAKNLK